MSKINLVYIEKRKVMLENNHSSLLQPKKPFGGIIANSWLVPAVFIQRSRLPLALLILLLQVIFVGNASAHSDLVESQPANGALLENSPERVIATFSEELDSRLSSMFVFDAQETQVDNGDGSVDLNDLDHLSMIVSLPSLSAGTYTVHWDAFSAEDGDETEGDFAFTISGDNVAPETADQSAGSNNGLIIGATAVGVIILMSIVVIVRRWKSTPVQ